MKEIKSIDYKTAIDFIYPLHYSGRKPKNVTWAFGWYINHELVAVLTFGKPASHTLCNGVCGTDFSARVYELNRVCRLDSCKEQLSEFVAGCLRILSKENLIIVSYSDMAMKHHGYIYQACNFLYTGKTPQRTERYVDGKHSKNYIKNDKRRQIRSSKHRYVYFAMKNKRLKKQVKESLKYEIQDYPKGENENYVLGTYIQPQIVK